VLRIPLMRYASTLGSESTAINTRHHFDGLAPRRALMPKQLNLYRQIIGNGLR
jgi:hypothetical protein